MTIAGDLIIMADQDVNFLKTGNETWCVLYDPHPKHQSCKWKSRYLLKNLHKSKGKVMLEVFFDAHGLTHYYSGRAYCKKRNVCQNPPSPLRCSEKVTSRKMGTKQLVSSA
jgi:hypothetical protein